MQRIGRKSQRFPQNLERAIVFIEDLLVELLDRQLLRLERPHGLRADFFDRLVGMQDDHLAAALFSQELGPLDDLLVQMRRLVVGVHRIDSRNDHGRLLPRHRLDEPEWVIEIADQVPVGIGQRRAFRRTMVMRPLDHVTRLPRRRLATNDLGHMLVGRSIRLDAQTRRFSLGDQFVDGLVL